MNNYFDLLIINIKNFFSFYYFKYLFINVEESIVIFLPISQFGCLSILFNESLFIFFGDTFNNDPPDAVKYIFSILLFNWFEIPNQIEKCSESTGIKAVLFFFNSLLIMFHAHIIDSYWRLQFFL